MLILSIVIGVLILCCLIGVGVYEDAKKHQQVKEKKLETKEEDTPPLITFHDVMDKLEDRFKCVKYGTYEASYKTLKLQHVASYKGLEIINLTSKNGKGLLSYDKYGTIECQGIIKEFIDTNYTACSSLIERVKMFLNDLIKHAVIYKSAGLKLYEFYKEKGIKFYEKCDANVWYSVNDGEYYTDCHTSLYRLSDWTTVDTDEAYEIVKNAKIELSEDPKKVHWGHFLKLEMLEKKAREKKMQEFVDNVLSKQVKYNDLQLQYEMIPTAPITDIETFKNFCKIVKEDVYYEDHEIQNYIFMKKLK